MDVMMYSAGYGHIFILYLGISKAQLSANRIEFVNEKRRHN